MNAEGSSSRAIEVDGEEDSGAESEASAGAGSTGALDRTDEDFTRDQVRHTGFMGKNSEVTWLQRLREQNKYGDNDQGNETQKRPNNMSAALLTSKLQNVQLPMRRLPWLNPNQAFLFKTPAIIWTTCRYSPTM